MSFEDNPADDRYQLDQCIDEIKRLKNLLADAERERDHAQANVIELNQMLGDAMHFHKQELERAERAADARQAEIVAWLREGADESGKRAEASSQQSHREAYAATAVVARNAADAIEAGEWRAKEGGDG